MNSWEEQTACLRRLTDAAGPEANAAADDAPWVVQYLTWCEREGREVTSREYPRAKVTHREVAPCPVCA